MFNKAITVNRKGMITLPAPLRKKYNLHEGSQIVILDIEGKLEIVPIFDDFDQIHKMLSSRKIMEKSYEESIEIELKLEDPDD